MKVLGLISLLLSVHLAQASGTSLKATPDHGQVVFNATAIGLKFQGKGEGPEGEVQIGKTVTGRFKFNMASLDTGIGLRNQHMKEKYLEVNKYPHGELQVDEVTGFNPENPEGVYAFKGRLTVHNVSTPLQGRVTIKKGDNALNILAEFETKISHFSMPLPAYAGVALKDDVKVVVESQLH